MNKTEVLPDENTDFEGGFGPDQEPEVEPQPEPKAKAKSKVKPDPKAKTETKAKPVVAEADDGPSWARRWLVQIRHSPCPVKRLEVEADTEEEAVEAFWEANTKAVAKTKKSGERLMVLVDKGRKDPDVELTVTPLVANE